MAFRNLTRKFVDIRNAAKANRSLNISAKDDDDTTTLSSNRLLKQPIDSINWKPAQETLPPAWVDSMEMVEEDIGKIQLKMGELEAMHNKRLMVNFETDEAQQEREIEYKTREITDVFHHAESILKKFGRSAEDPNISAQERAVRGNMLRSMAKRLQGQSMAFRGKQKEYLGKVKEQKTGSGNQGFDFLNDSKKSSLNAAALQMDGDQGFTLGQMQMLDDTEDLVNQRDEEITKIAQSIEELAQIFKELAVLVIDQGTILDRIDYNMENAVEHAKEGVVQLEKAEESQKNAMSVKCIILLIVLIIIMLGILIWKHSGQN